LVFIGKSRDISPKQKNKELHRVKLPQHVDKGKLNKCILKLPQHVDKGKLNKCILKPKWVTWVH